MTTQVECAPAVPHARALLDAIRSLTTDLEPAAVIDRTVVAVRELVGARYAAIGILGPDGMLNEVFSQGRDDTGQRHLGAPEQKPGMVTIPIPHTHDVFGRLYLADKTDGGEFTDEDVAAAHELAAAAGVAIGNARRHEQSARRQRWLESFAEVQEVLLTSTDRTAALSLISRRAREVAGADFAAIMLPAHDDELVVEVVSGEGLGERNGFRYALAGSMAGEVLRSGRSVVSDDVAADERFFSHLGGWPTDTPELGPALFIPLSTSAGTLGVLVVASHRSQDARFALTTAQLVGSLAGQAALALERLRAREDRARLAVFKDRDRIARDLHDHVIQQLFATGLSLQSAARNVGDDESRGRIERSVDDIDATIAQIRAMIHQLNQRDASLSIELAEISEAAARSLGFEPTLTVEGPLDDGIPQNVRPHLLAVLREALTNVARHAHATSVHVVVTVGDEITVRVDDNGVGLGTSTRRSGLRNLRARAESLGGDLRLGTPAGEGTRVLWCVPLRG